MNNLDKSLLDHLKSFFGEKCLSDATLHIIEENFSSSHASGDLHIAQSNAIGDTSGLLENKKSDIEFIEDIRVLFRSQEEEEVAPKKIIKSSELYCSLPVHLIMLTSHSIYFRQMMLSSVMEESISREIKLTVKAGCGYYMKLLIQLFYDHDLLNDRSPIELLRILELADYIQCEEIISRINELVDALKISDIKHCIYVSSYFIALNLGLPQAIKTCESLLTTCYKFVVDYFSPIEDMEQEMLNEFLSLSFELLISALEQDSPLARNECSLLYYVFLWFKYDEERQVEKKIEKVFHLLDYRNITVAFLYDIIGEDNIVFNKWEGFKDWYIQVVTYHFLSKQRGSLSLSLPVPVTSLPFCGIVCEKVFQLTKISEYGFATQPSSFMYKGYKLSPQLKLERGDHRYNFRLKLGLYLSNGRKSNAKTFYIRDIFSQFDIYYKIYKKTRAVRNEVEKFFRAQSFHKFKFEEYGSDEDLSRMLIGTFKYETLQHLASLQLSIRFDNPDRLKAYHATYAKAF